MNLSEKYTIKEDNFNITLSEIRMVENKIDGKLSGTFTEKSLPIGYYSPTAQGRVQLYQRMLNTEISNLEKQGLQDILAIVQETSDNIMTFFKEQQAKIED